MNREFTLANKKPPENIEIKKKKNFKKKPVGSVVFVALLASACLMCELFMPKDPTYMDLYSANVSPCGEFLFGTDTMGRDIFSMIFYGGRISLLTGFLSTAISVVIAIIFGALSGLAPKWLDDLLMRFTEIVLSIPNLLLVILIQAILGKANVLSISFVIGIAGWTSMAKVIRSEVRQIRNSEYIIAAKCMGASFFRIVFKHLAPNFVSSIMFMVVMNIRSAIISESTLSFIGIGLPIEIISWGSMLSLAEKSLLSGSWWIILVPGLFLVLTLVCITNIGNYLQKSANKSQSNL